MLNTYKWKRSNRIAALEDKLKNILDQNEESRINHEIRSDKFDSIKFSHFYMDSNDVFHDTFDDDSLVKRAMRNVNSLKTPPFAKQTALLTVTHSYKTDKQLAIINKDVSYNTRCLICFEEEQSIIHHLIYCSPAMYIMRAFSIYISRLLNYNLSNMIQHGNHQT